MRRVLGLLFFATFLWVTWILLDDAFAEIKKKKLEVPSPDEIRDFSPQPNGLMLVTYANERVFAYPIAHINPKPECNQIILGGDRRIKIITQAVSQAYEYVLADKPVMVKEWIPYPIKE